MKMITLNTLNAGVAVQIYVPYGISNIYTCCLHCFITGPCIVFVIGSV